MENVFSKKQGGEKFRFDYIVELFTDEPEAPVLFSKKLRGFKSEIQVNGSTPLHMHLQYGMKHLERKTEHAGHRVKIQRLK